MKGLIVDEPWISLTLSGEKTWEMRSQHTCVRGRIALIRKGSGLVAGIAELIDSIGPLDAIAWRAHADKHRIPAAQQDQTAAWTIAWVLRNACPLDLPVAYRHPGGAVIWVDLPQETVQQFRLTFPVRQTGSTATMAAEPGASSRTHASPPLEIAQAMSLLVPMARDGSWFSPALQRSTGFTIGPKGDEIVVADYRDALARLRVMPTPRWRRPNANGNLGIVAGVCWVEPPRR